MIGPFCFETLAQGICFFLVFFHSFYSSLLPNQALFQICISFFLPPTISSLELVNFDTTIYWSTSITIALCIDVHSHGNDCCLFGPKMCRLWNRKEMSIHRIISEICIVSDWWKQCWIRVIQVDIVRDESSWAFLPIEIPWTIFTFIESQILIWNMYVVSRAVLINVKS